VAKQGQGARGCPAAAGDPCQTMLAGLNSRRRRALGHGVPESFNIGSRDGCDLKAAEQRLDVALYTAFVCCKRAGLFCCSARRHDAAGGGSLNVSIAEIRDCPGPASILFLAGRVESFCDVAKNAPGLIAGKLRRPGRAMAANGLPALPPIRSAIFENIRYSRSFPPPRTKANDRSFSAVPQNGIRAHGCDRF
jgi:hypothetical protein